MLPWAPTLVGAQSQPDEAMDYITVAEEQMPGELPAPEAAAQLETTVVTGTRTEHRFVDSPVEVQLLTAEDIRNSGASTVAELLAREGGVYVAPAAGRGSISTNIEIQGLSSEHVLILVDGRRAIGRIDGAIDLTRYRTANIERIEIVKGPSSALYGSDALGGVVNIITRAGGGGAGLTLRSDVDDNHEAYGNFDWRSGGWAGSVNGGYILRSPFDLDESTATVDGPDTEGRYFSSHQRWTPGEVLSLDARFDYALDDVERLDGGTGGAVYDVRKRTEELRAALAPTLQFGERTRLSIDAYYTRYYDQYVSEQRGTDEDDTDERTVDELYTGGAQLDHRLGSHWLSLGFEYQYEELDADRLEQTGERDRQSVYAQDEWTLFSGRLTLVPGLRYDRDSQFGDQWSPKLALRYDLADTWVLRAGYGHGFRAPDFKQMLLLFENPSVGYRVEGNPDLRPERSRGYNAGASWYPNPRASLELSVFHNEVDDLIEIILSEEGPPTIYSYRNVQRARISGAGLQARWQPFGPLNLRLGYGWVDTEDRDTGEPLSGRPEHRVNAGVRFQRPAYAVGLRGVWIGERRYGVDLDTGGSPTSAGTADPYALFDLRAEWNAWSWFKLAAGIDNLLDEGDPQYLPIQPRSVYFEWRKEFR